MVSRGASRDATAEPTRMDPARTSTRDLLASRGLACAGSRERRAGAHTRAPASDRRVRVRRRLRPRGTDRRGSAAPPASPWRADTPPRTPRVLQRERALRARARGGPARASPAPRRCFARPRRCARARSLLRERRLRRRILPRRRRGDHRPLIPPRERRRRPRGRARRADPGVAKTRLRAIARAASRQARRRAAPVGTLRAASAAAGSPSPPRGDGPRPLLRRQARSRPRGDPRRPARRLGRRPGRRRRLASPSPPSSRRGRDRRRAFPSTSRNDRLRSIRRRRGCVRCARSCDARCGETEKASLARRREEEEKFAARVAAAGGGRRRRDSGGGGGGGRQRTRVVARRRR